VSLSITFKTPVRTLEELLISSLAQTDALAKLLIEKGLITREEFMQKISEERTMYQELHRETPYWWLRRKRKIFANGYCVQ